MRRKMSHWILCICLLTQLTSCIGEEEYADTPQGNFEQLWKIIDEQYCFLDYKGIDWNAIKVETQKKIRPGMDGQALFEVLDGMLAQLQDGHVNLTCSFNQSRYDFWSDSPRNFVENLIESNQYLGSDYRLSSGMRYRILPDNIGYIYYESFQSGIGEGNLSEVFAHLAICNGIIIDVRQNSGGNVTNSARFASRFVNEKTLTGYIRHKIGPGHSDFSEPFAIYLEPSDGIRWQKKVVVLTNRHSYSATNDFVNQMKGLPNVTIMGDKTGGGAGMPFTSELPNGWTVRFSASPHYNDQMECIEWGIEPDIKVDMNSKDESKGIDTIIERARRFLNR